ncbi:MAG: dipeptidase PepE [Bacteroidales bacterium]|jgi:dipeptidase E|nr:dipeptidase PepE [Bacteroidales bacterium]
MKKMLLISNSTNYGENYLGWSIPEIELFALRNKFSKALFIPYAGVSFSYDEYEFKVSNALSKIGIEIKSIHHFEDPVKAVKEAECIMVGGGNTFHLAYMMHKLNLMEAVREVVEQGTPYVGWSAGSNLTCPTLRTTNDMPIIMPESFDTLNLVPFQINPHFLDPNPAMDEMMKHGGETRADRIEEFTTLHQDITVVGLREGCSLLVEGKKMTLRGGRPLIILKHNQKVEELAPYTDISHLLEL